MTINITEIKDIDNIILYYKYEMEKYKTLDILKNIYRTIT